MLNHPIFGDVIASELAKADKVRMEAAELKRMMEDLWNSSRVVNANRAARYVKPMRLGSEWGYQDDILAG